jgi:hypothetical protein
MWRLYISVFLPVDGREVLKIITTTIFIQKDIYRPHSKECVNMLPTSAWP